jgi:hypothetical protein
MELPGITPYLLRLPAELQCGVYSYASAIRSLISTAGVATLRLASRLVPSIDVSTFSPNLHYHNGDMLSLLRTSAAYTVLPKLVLCKCIIRLHEEVPKTGFGASKRLHLLLHTTV